jgi:hypothetical protein
VPLDLGHEIGGPDVEEVPSGERNQKGDVRGLASGAADAEDVEGEALATRVLSEIRGVQCPRPHS